MVFSPVRFKYTCPDKMTYKAGVVSVCSVKMAVPAAYSISLACAASDPRCAVDKVPRKGVLCKTKSNSCRSLSVSVVVVVVMVGVVGVPVVVPCGRG